MNDVGMVLESEDLAAWRGALRRAGMKLVVTNGCFDLLHVGHVTYLQSARRLGDVLLVGVNGDASVRTLKGADRPLNPAPDRAAVLVALRCVNAVCIFEEVRAVRLLQAAQPDVYVKGGDYTLDTLDQEERRVVEAGGGRIEIVPFVPGKSTTGLIQRMNAQSAGC
ncbi:MAG TPA: adenylyltransferase/cytidyltransferase family protein [Candidatus Acidoferrum sp.]|nr:adenylyltransferase/cytidyltransferase family protein [Candidatus Acidoferrum sp.]